MSPLKKLYSIVFGYDIFISYSRKDSLDYAYAVAAYFNSKNYACYIDQISGTIPGERIPNIIINAVKRSKGFVLIGSEGAQLTKEGDAIAQEIDLFLKRGRDKFFIPINVDNAIDMKRKVNDPEHATAIERRIFGLPLVAESKENFERKVPGKEVLVKIENALKFTKKSIQLRNIAIATVAMVGVVMGASALYSFATVADAAEKVRVANIKEKDANARVKQKDIEVKEKTAQLEMAGDSLKKSMRKLDSSNQRIKKVEGDILKEKAQLLVISREKDRIKDSADKYNASAVRYEKLSSSRSQAYEAKLLMDENPDQAGLLALNSIKQFEDEKNIDPSVEKAFRTVAAKQTGISLGSFDWLSQSILISPDNTLAIIADSDNKIRLFDLQTREQLPDNPDFNNEDEIKTLRFDETGKYLVFQTMDDDHAEKTRIFQREDNGQSLKLIFEKSCLQACVSSNVATIAIIDTFRQVSILKRDLAGNYTTHTRLTLTTREKPTAIALNSNDTIVAVGFENAWVEMCYFNGTQLSHTIETGFQDGGIRKAIYKLRFSPDSRFLLVNPALQGIDQYQELKLFDISDKWREIQKFSLSHEKIIADYLDDRYYKLVNNYGRLICYDLKKGQTIHSNLLELEFGGENMTAGSFTSTGNEIILGSSEGYVYEVACFDTAIKVKNHFFQSPYRIATVGGSRDGSFVMEGSSDGVVRIFSANAGKKNGEWSLPFEKSINNYEVSHDGKRIMLTDERNHSYWDLHDPDAPKLLLKHRNFSKDYNGKMISLDGRWAVVPDSIPNTSTLYQLDDLQHGLGRSVNGDCEFSPASKFLIEKDAGIKLTRLDGIDGRGLPIVADSFKYCMSRIFSENEKWMASIQNVPGEGESIRLWSLSTGSNGERKVSKILNSRIGDTHFSGDSILFYLQYSKGDTSIQFVHLGKDGSTGKEESLKLSGYNKFVFSDDGSLMLSYYSPAKNGITDDHVASSKLWRLTSSAPARALGVIDASDHVNNAKFSPAGNYLITERDNNDAFTLWRVRPDSLILAGSLQGPFVGSDMVWKSAFDLNEKFLFFHRFSIVPRHCFVRLDALDINPVAQELMIGEDNFDEFIPSRTGDSLFLIKKVKYGWDVIGSKQKVAVYLKKMNTTDSSPTEIFKSASMLIWGNWTSDDFKHYITVGHKNATISLTDLNELKARTVASVGRDVSWEEWVDSHDDRSFQEQPEVLDVEENKYMELYYQMKDAYSKGDSSMFRRIKHKLYSQLVVSDNDSMCARVAAYFRNEFDLFKESVSLSTRAIALNPEKMDYVGERGLAYWYLEMFDEAQRDVDGYLQWYNWDKKDYENENLYDIMNKASGSIYEHYKPEKKYY